MKEQAIILNDIKVELTLDYFQNRSKSKSPGAIKMYEKYIPIANEIARPKAVIRMCEVEISDDDTIIIDNTPFKNKLLSSKLKGQKSVFVIAITAGSEISNCEKISTEAARDMVAGGVLGQATRYTINYIRENLHIDAYSILQPGTLEEFQIENNKAIFEILKPFTDKIEINLTDTGYMIPWNSLSLILF